MFEQSEIVVDAKVTAGLLYLFSNPYMVMGRIQAEYDPMAYHVANYWHPGNDNMDAMASIIEEMFDSSTSSLVIDRIEEQIEKLYLPTWEPEVELRNKDLGPTVGNMPDDVLEALESRRRVIIRFITQPATNQYIEDEDDDCPSCMPGRRYPIKKTRFTK